MVQLGYKVIFRAFAGWLLPPLIFGSSFRVPSFSFPYFTITVRESFPSQTVCKARADATSMRHSKVHAWSSISEPWL